jgi:hypothetical protein
MQKRTTTIMKILDDLKLCIKTLKVDSIFNWITKTILENAMNLREYFNMKS